MITLQQKNSISQIAMPVAVVLLLAWYILICCDYPYYFIWDMDYATTLDTVLIHSKLLPDHINHPNFGMYLLLFFSEKIAHFLDIVSVLDLREIGGSLNPLAGMAELTDFVRLHSPFLVMGIAFLLSMAIYLTFGLPQRYLLLFLIFLGTQESLVYHSSMIRSELYSVFYWSAAVSAMAIAAKVSTPIKRITFLLATGFLLGLCFLTKIQSLFYLAAAAILLPLVFSVFQGEQRQDHKEKGQKGATWILAVSFFNITAFLVLSIASYSIPIPVGISTWAEFFGVTAITVFFFLAFLSLFLCQLFLCLTKKMSSDIFRFSCFFSIVGFGFILSFASFFLLYPEISMSLEYLLLTFKISFLRWATVFRFGDFSIWVDGFLQYVSYNPTVFFVNIVLGALVILGYCCKFIRITKGQLMMCLLVTVLALVNIFIGTRPMLRDILWKEVLLNFLSLFYFAILVTRAVRYNRILLGAGCGLLIVLFFVNCEHCCLMPDRIDANFNHYGWWQDKWFSEIYSYNQPKYRQIMQEKYNNTTMRVAEVKAAEHRQIRRTVDFVFKNQDITHRNIGIVFEGFSVWSTDLDYRIAEAPPAMRGAILVDNASIKPQRNTFFKEEYVRQDSECLDKFKSPSPAKRISVLSRHDLRIFLFVSASDVPHIVGDQIVPTDYKIILQNSNQSIELDGLEIRNYSEIALDKITQQFFFVICKI